MYHTILKIVIMEGAILHTLLPIWLHYRYVKIINCVTSWRDTIHLIERLAVFIVFVLIYAAVIGDILIQTLATVIFA